jgi:hypothetical protein
MTAIRSLAHDQLRRAIQSGKVSRALLFLVALCAGSPAIAVPVDEVPLGTSHLNVETADFAGDGDEVAYLVIDFRAAGGGSFAFGYRHDGMATAQQMLTAFEAENVLGVFLEEFSFGPAVRGIAYPREEQEDIFPGAFGGPRSWVLWEGSTTRGSVEWTTSDVGINGVEFGNTEPTVFLPNGGFFALSTAAEFPGAEPLLPIPGDFNSDAVVDGDDLRSALLGFGASGGPTLARGDADRDGDVDRADVTLWQENVGSRIPAPLGPAGVPEPQTMAIALSVTLLFVLWRDALTAKSLQFS